MRRWITRVACVVFVLTGLSACIRVGREGASVSLPVPMSPALESRTPDYRVPDRAGQLTRAQMDSVAPRIRQLRADPRTLVQVVGDTLRMADVLRVFALDSTGAVIGELPSYDFAFSGRGMRLLADGRFVFSRAGTMQFTASLHEFLWKGRAAELPAATVSITVYREAP